MQRTTESEGTAKTSARDETESETNIVQPFSIHKDRAYAQIKESQKKKSDAVIYDISGDSGDRSPCIKSLAR